MIKNLLFLHGWQASPSEHWFPEVKDYFTSKGYRVFIPALSGNYFPKKDNWVKVVSELQPDEDWILIGHSLGGVTVLKFLEITKKPIAQSVLIATPFDAMKFGAIENFFETGFDWKKIKANCSKFDIINEDNDPAIPLEHGQKFAKNLGGRLHVVRGFTHFHDIDLDLLDKIIKNSSR